jgi:hypothetical protein
MRSELFSAYLWHSCIACLYAYLPGAQAFCLSWKSLECMVVCMFVCIFTWGPGFLLVLEELGMHGGLHVCMIFTWGPGFLLVLEELGMHGGLHVCMHIYLGPRLFACPGRAWNAWWIACLYAYLPGAQAFCLSWKSLKCMVDCMSVCIFTWGPDFLLVLVELGMHGGLDVCMHI